MLTRSTNASPCIPGFHYAPTRSPRHSPSRISAAGARRPSPSSSPAVLADAVPAVSSPLSHPLSAAATVPAAPSASMSPAYASADAATQYSPMEPFDYAAHPHRYPPQPSTPLNPPSIPGPAPMEPGVEQGVEQTQPDQPSQTQSHPQSTTSTTSPAVADGHPPAAAAMAPPQPPSQQPQQQPLQTPSPNKRRSSQSATPGETAVDGIVSPSSLARSSPTHSKRVKAEAEPAKMLPERYELCAVEDMVVLIANMLGELIETNDALALKAGHLTRFHSRTAPGISVLDYLNRLAKHATLTPPLLLSMVYYIDRLCAMYPDFTINTLTVHRFLITAATVAAKGLSDSFWNNSTYARVGGVRVTELKMLELEFLYRLEWKIVPNPEVLAAYYRPLVERCSGYVLPADTTDWTMDVTANAFNNNSSIPVNREDRGPSSTSLVDKDMVISGSGPARDSNL